MDNGNINDFIKNHREVNRIQLVSYHISIYEGRYDLFLKLIDAARGLEYLHSQNVAHGDLKGVH